MQIGEVNPLPETAKYTVTDPAGQGSGPQDHRNRNHMPKIFIPNPGDKERAWVGKGDGQMDGQTDRWAGGWMVGWWVGR